MAIVTIPELGRRFDNPDEIRTVLGAHGVDYERAEPDVAVSAGASAEEVLEAYRDRVEALKADGGYVTADVIDVFPSTPGLDAMLNRFNTEHWHSEDEVRFIVEGRGVFHIHPAGQPVMAVEVGPGDLIRVPAGIHHWFDLCNDRRIRAIRLFKDPSGWSPNYTQSGVDQGFQPLCFGPAYLPPAARM
jgi:1,2-dihydroxy-3-keto-5-methylthiopentene dioxygenase